MHGRSYSSVAPGVSFFVSVLSFFFSLLSLSLSSHVIIVPSRNVRSRACNELHRNYVSRGVVTVTRGERRTTRRGRGIRKRGGSGRGRKRGEVQERKGGVGRPGFLLTSASVDTLMDN